MQLTHRALATWAPRPDTAERRWAPFKAGYYATLQLLERELQHLDADHVIMATLHREHHIRLDGRLKENAPEDPGHPGVEISFDSRMGRLTYATDVCRRWRDNVRSIALGLEALRAVDRYGCSTRGEQYAGFRALPAGTGGAGAPDTVAAAQDVIRAVLVADDDPPGAAFTDGWAALHRRALKLTHPDHGGDVTVFRHVEVAGRILRQAGVIT